MKGYNRLESIFSFLIQALQELGEFHSSTKTRKVNKWNRKHLLNSWKLIKKPKKILVCYALLLQNFFFIYKIGFSMENHIRVLF